MNPCHAFITSRVTSTTHRVCCNCVLLHIGSAATTYVSHIWIYITREVMFHIRVHVTHSYVWHDSFTCVVVAAGHSALQQTLCVHPCMCGITQLAQQLDVPATLIVAASPLVVAAGHSHRKIPTCMTQRWCGMTRWYNMPRSFMSHIWIHVTRGVMSRIWIHVPHSYVWHDSFICVMWFIIICVIWFINMHDVAHWYVWL